VPREVTLEVGETYFSVFYADQKLLHPIFETLIYLGPDSSSQEPAHLFQYAKSFHSDGNWNEMTPAQRAEFDEPPTTSFEAAHIDPVVDAEGLIEELAKWHSRAK
jgi:hypothetical protein